MRVSDKREAPRAAELTPPAPVTAVPTPDVLPVVTRVPTKKVQKPSIGRLRITADALHETRYGEKKPKPTYTPEELAALEADNDPRLTRSGVIVAPPSRDTRGGTPFPPRSTYEPPEE